MITQRETMVNITKVYTKTGDQGETSLAGGMRVSKSSPRMHAIGRLDELNAYLGWCVVGLAQDTDNDTEAEIARVVLAIQHQLFDAGAQLAVLPEDRQANTPRLLDDDINQLESSIDQLNEGLPKLTSFILPGGGETSCRFHMTRAVCRNLERDLVELAQDEHEPVDDIVLAYINRLSDWLFVAARAIAAAHHYQETLWQSQLRSI